MFTAIIFFAMNSSRPIDVAASPFKLADVTILPGLQKTRQDVDRKYLLSLDPLRLLNGFYINAGLKPKGEGYGGWEKRGIAGHSLGHYLSGCALMFGATGDPEFKKRCQLIVRELRDCQKAKGTGFIGGMPDADRVFAELKARNIRSQGFDLNGNWVPWYNIHKTLSGLLDAYRIADVRDALPILIDHAKWIADLTHDYTDADWQTMLACEHGGMNEALADLYSITHDPSHLALAEKFYHKAILAPLADGERKLAGKHGNTQIPKIIGAARLYEVTGDARFQSIARNFWQEVVEDHTYAMGGHGMGEHFGPPKKLSDRLSDSNAETCNSYNMLKLTDHLMSWGPSVELGDFAERTEINHILTSQELTNGGVTYFVPLRPGAKKTYSSAFDDFTCCRGTGMENHAKYAQGIYYHHDNHLWVNQYTPSRLTWSEKGVSVTMKTEYPKSDRVEINVDSKAPRRLQLSFRVPGWAKEGATLSDKAGVYSGVAGKWLTIEREFKGSETLKLTIPMQLRAEAMPDNPKRVALMYGPTLLVGEWHDSKALSGPIERTPVFVGPVGSADQWLLPNSDGTWRSANNMRPFDMTFRPFYEIQHERYSAYVDVFSSAEWDAREAEYRMKEEALAALERRTVDHFSPGEMQSERDHGVASQQSAPGEHNGRKYRHAMNNGWFSFDLVVDPDAENELVFTYWGGDHRTFNILVDGEKFALESQNSPTPNAFYDKTYPLSKAFLKGRKKITVRFEATATSWAGGLFGARTLRKL